MQNNVVKRTLLALLCAFVLCAALFAAAYLPIESSNKTSVSTFDDVAKASFKNKSVEYVGNGFTVTEYSSSVKRGENAKIVVNAEKGTEIDIAAYYKSGKSEANVFCPQTAANESIVWEWKVPKNSTSDSIRIVLRSDDTYATFNIRLI